MPVMSSNTEKSTGVTDPSGQQGNHPSAADIDWLNVGSVAGALIGVGLAASAALAVAATPELLAGAAVASGAAATLKVIDSRNKSDKSK